MTAESGTLPDDADDAPYHEDLERIERALHEAEASSPLPTEAPDRAGLERLLIALRF